MLNVDSALMTALRTTGISGHRPREPKRPAKTNIDESYLLAIRQAVLLLGDGKWHKTEEVERRASRFPGVGVLGLLDACGAAESDSGRWHTIPTDRTPDRAPDERGESKGKEITEATQLRSHPLTECFTRPAGSLMP
jgi:hypothetical protein